MKNLVPTMIAVSAIFLLSDAVLAGGGGGGKGGTRADITVTNTEAAGGTTYVVLIVADGANLPTTIGELREEIEFVAPGQSTSEGRNLRSGNYRIFAEDAETIAGEDGSIPIDVTSDASVVRAVTLGSTDINLNLQNDTLTPGS